MRSKLSRRAHRKHCERRNITGPIPRDVGACVGLRRLWLQKNALVGEIPAGLADLTLLIELRLEANALEGGVPARLGELDGSAAASVGTRPGDDAAPS